MKAVFIVGPTASGKSAVAVELALMTNGEVISADAISVYERLDIGAAKPTMEERKGVVHHLLGEIPPDEPFSAARYREMALSRINAVHSKGKLPIVAGGTGLYVHSLLHPLDINVPANEKFREAAASRERENPGCLHAELKLADPQAAQRIHPNDTKRVIRALEIAMAQKDTAYDFRKSEPLPFEPLLFGLYVERGELYRRIGARVDAMLDKGLAGEVRALHDEGLDHSLPALQGLGYKQLLSFFRGECGYDEAIEAVKRETRRFAKRQETWFKRENVVWLDTNEKPARQIASEIFVYLAGK